MRDFFFHTNLIFPKIKINTCVGSYFYSVFNNFCDISSKDDILLYLTNFYLKQEKIYLQKIIKGEGNIAWKAQPLCYYSDNISHFNRGMVDFLINKFNFNIQFIKKETSIDLIDITFKNINSSSLLIIGVDEFYISHNKPFYYITHNPHSLLIRGFDIKKKEVEVIDTEYTEKYRISFDELRKAYFSEKFENNIYLIKIYDFNNKLDYIENFKNYLNNLIKNFNISELIIEYKKRFENFDLINMHFKSLQYLVIFKIFPYIHMRKHLMSKLKIQFKTKQMSTLLKLSDSIKKSWTDFSLIIIRKIIKSAFDEGDIIKKLRILEEQELEMSEKLFKVKL